MTKLENSKSLKYSSFSYNPQLDSRENTSLFSKKIEAAIEVFNRVGPPSDSIWEQAKKLSETSIISKAVNEPLKQTQPVSIKPSKSTKIKRKYTKKLSQTAKV
jgi:hypothetical protein